MGELEQVFATGVTLTYGQTYTRLRFTQEDMDLEGKNPTIKVVADVTMSRELLLQLKDILNRIDKQFEEAVQASHEKDSSTKEGNNM